MGQTDQDQANMNDLTRYDQILTAFADACTNAVNNHDTATMAICSQVFNTEHDILKPFMDINRDAMTKVIMGSGDG